MTVSTTRPGVENGQLTTVAAGVSGCTGWTSEREAQLLRVATQKTLQTRPTALIQDLA